MIHACQLARGITDTFLHGDPVLIHGANGKRDKNGVAIIGADVLGHDIAVDWGWTIEPFLARWDLYGNAAGPMRNAEMAEGGAHIALAFGALTHGGKRAGTGDMGQRCLAAGIVTIVVPRAGA